MIRVTRLITKVVLLTCCVFALSAVAATAAVAATGDTFTAKITVGGVEHQATFVETGSNTCSIVGEMYNSSRPDISCFGDYTKSQIPGGELVIPSTVKNGSKTFSVTAIGEAAFYNCTGLTSVTIPSSIKTIDQFAFNKCLGLTSVTIPATVTSMGTHVFDECKGLRSVTFASGSPITAVPAYCFNNCSALKDVMLSNGITSIEERAFFGAYLPEFTIPNTVTILGEYAFGRTKTRHIIIPASVKTIGKDAFADCYCLQDVTFANRANSNTLAINEYAFSACSALTSVDFPDCVNELGRGVFTNCTALTSVRLPENPAVTTLDWTFFGCKALRSITIPNNITSLASGFYTPFSSCSALTEVTIPASITTFDLSWFDDCYALTSIVLEHNGDTPKTIQYTYLSETAISEGYGKIYVKAPTTANVNSLLSNYQSQTSGKYLHPYNGDDAALAPAFAAYSTRPASVGLHALLKADGTVVACDANGDLLEGGSAYTHDTSRSDYYNDRRRYAVTDIHFASGVTEIPDYAFTHYPALQSVAIPKNVTRVGAEAFMECDALTELGIANGAKLERMAYQAFNGCGALQEVDLTPAASLKFDLLQADGYEQGLFSGCNALRSMKIPDSVGNIPDYFVSGCNALSAFNPSSNCDFNLPSSLGDAYNLIGNSAFSSCFSMTEVAIPTSGRIDLIAGNAFAYSGLERVTLSSNIAGLESNAFSNCPNLYEVTIDLISDNGSFSHGTSESPASVFGDCDALTTVNFGPNFAVERLNATFNSCNALSSIVVPPAAADLYNTFQNCSALRDVTLPEGITMLDGTFWNCSALPAISIPSTVSSIQGTGSGNDPHGTFGSCYALTDVEFVDGCPDILNTGNSCFNSCISLVSIDLPDSIVYLAPHTFRNCTALMDPGLPDGLLEIDDMALYGCKSLATLDIPDSVYSIDEGAFAECSNLVGVHLPDSLAVLSANIFLNCTSLKSVTIPASVEAINCFSYSAWTNTPIFEDCTSLEEVVWECDFSNLESSEPNQSYWPDGIFQGCSNLKTVVYMGKKPHYDSELGQDQVTYPPDCNIDFYYRVGYYPDQASAEAGENLAGYCVAREGSNMMGTAAPSAANIWDGAWMRAREAESAITATSLSDSGWALITSWKGVMWTTLPQGGEISETSTTLTAAAAAKEISATGSTDLGGSMSYTWYECSNANGANPQQIGTGSSLSLSGLERGSTHYYYCVAESSLTDLDAPTATSRVITLSVSELPPVYLSISPANYNISLPANYMNVAGQCWDMRQCEITVENRGNETVTVWYDIDMITPANAFGAWYIQSGSMTLAPGASKDLEVSFTNGQSTGYYEAALIFTNASYGGDEVARATFKCTVGDGQPGKQDAYLVVSGPTYSYQSLPKGEPAAPLELQYAEFQNAAGDTLGSTGISYQWCRTLTGLVEDGAPISGATGPTYTPPTNAPGTFYYYCYVTGTLPSSLSSDYTLKNSSTTSDVATVVVSTASNPDPETYDKPELQTLAEEVQGFIDANIDDIPDEELATLEAALAAARGAIADEAATHEDIVQAAADLLDALAAAEDAAAHAVHGEWKNNPKGWWYEFEDGSWPASCWKRIDGERYYFNAAGYTASGWFTEGGTTYYLSPSGKHPMVTGWQQINNKQYLFEPDGAMHTGWLEEDGEKYYFAADGVMQTGLTEIDGDIYCFDSDGTMLAGWQQVGDDWYYFDEGGAAHTGWMEEDGDVYFFGDDGVMAIGWAEIGDEVHYFDDYGVMLTGWQQVGGEDYYFDFAGVMLTGYQNIDGVWYDLGEDGASQGTLQSEIDDAASYAAEHPGESSALQDAIEAAQAIINDPAATPEQVRQAAEALAEALDGAEAGVGLNDAISEAEQYATEHPSEDLQQAIDDAQAVANDPNATPEELREAAAALEEALEAAIAADERAEALSYLEALIDEADDFARSHSSAPYADALETAKAVAADSNSTVQKINQAASALDAGIDAAWAEIEQGGTWKKDSKGWWYKRADGSYPKSRWSQIDGARYYFKSSGYMATGWQKIGGKWYYLKSSGAMATGWQKIGGKWYYLKASGVMVTGWQQISGTWYYLNSSGAMLTGWQKIGSKWYWFASSGAMKTGWLKLSGKWYYLNSSGAMVTGTQKIDGKTYKFNSSGVWTS